MRMCMCLCKCHLRHTSLATFTSHIYSLYHYRCLFHISISVPLSRSLSPSVPLTLLHPNMLFLLISVDLSDMHACVCLWMLSFNYANIIYSFFPSSPLRWIFSNETRNHRSFRFLIWKLFKQYNSYLECVRWHSRDRCFQHVSIIFQWIIQNATVRCEAIQTGQLVTASIITIIIIDAVVDAE